MYHHAITATINMDIHPKSNVTNSVTKSDKPKIYGPTRLPHTKVQETFMETVNTCNQESATVIYVWSTYMYIIVIYF
jgi:hypothetical protein